MQACLLSAFHTAPENWSDGQWSLLYAVHHIWLYYVTPVCLPDSQVGCMYMCDMQALSLVPLLVSRSCLPILVTFNPA